MISRRERVLPVNPYAAPYTLDPKRAALLVIDMQNDFVRSGAPQEVPSARNTIEAIQKLAEEFRAAAQPVLYTRFVTGPDETLMWTWSPECAPPTCSCWRGVTRTYEDAGGELEGSAIVAELTPHPGEIVIEKYGYDAFHHTQLDDALRANRVTDLVVVGTVTQICVQDTVHGAFHHGYRTFVVADAVSSYDDVLHQATLAGIAQKYGAVVTSQEIVTQFKPGRQTA
jgi:nicotinamidase-related amidase